MPNAKIHFLIGAAIGAGIYCLARKAQDQPIELPSLLGMGLAGGVAGLLPDLIEPATSPQHRQIAHSVAALLISISSVSNINQSQYIGQNQKEFLAVLALGYGSHLILDAGTPAGLPLI